MNDALEYARFIMSVILFCMGVFLLLDLFITGFDVKVLMFALGCLLVVHFLRPKWRNADKGDWYDAFDLILDFPFRCLSYLLRMFTRKSDIDLD